MQQMHAGADRNEVSRDVERVRDDQHTHQPNHDAARPAAQALGCKLTQPAARRERRPVADLLYRGHQRKRQ